MSYKDAINPIVAQHLAAGAAVHAGQCGQTVFQYADHYTVGSGMVYVTNPGQWQPIATFSGSLPDEPGSVIGETRISDDCYREAIWAGCSWLVVDLRT